MLLGKVPEEAITEVGRAAAQCPPEDDRSCLLFQPILSAYVIRCLKYKILANLLGPIHLRHGLVASGSGIYNIAVYDMGLW
jgi:hypothetical protein